MIIKIQNEDIDSTKILKLYPVAIVETGVENETTHISIEWVDTEGLGKVAIVGYAVVLNFENDKREFFYSTRGEFNAAIVDIQNQFNRGLE